MKSTVGTFGAWCLAAFALLQVRSAWAQIPDPGVPGPRAVLRDEYDFGDTALTFDGFPIEMRADVHYPADLTDGPFPIAVFLHGWHLTCYQGTTGFSGEWPCMGAHQPIPNYIGYDYVAAILASYGYIVVSISANGINAKDTTQFDVGMLWRARLIQAHLDQWSTFATTGGAPFGTTFVGKVDFDRVGTMGHSRGGEGVSRHYTYNRSLGSPYNVRAVLPLAPVNFSRELMDNVNLMVLLPYCDGDVADLQGVHYYDDSRFFAGDPTNKHTMLVMGGNHSYYNTIWTPPSHDPEGLATFPAATWDDWAAFEDSGRQDPWCGDLQPGNHKLNPPQARGTLKAYLTAFFRAYVGGESVFVPLLKGDAPPPPSAITSEIAMSYHGKDASRLDVNRTLDSSSLTVDQQGGAVTQSGLNPYELCGGTTSLHCLSFPQPAKREPHTTVSARAMLVPGLSQLRIGWDDMTATYENDLPAATDVSGYVNLQFRASVYFVDARNPSGANQDFMVTLTDGSGNAVSTLVSSSLQPFYPLFYPPGLFGPPNRAVPKLVLNTIRLPISQFAGVDLTDVRSVVFSFNQTASGALLVTDLSFSD